MENALAVLSSEDQYEKTSTWKSQKQRKARE